MKAMISQPMAGLTEYEINETRANAENVLVSRGYTVVESRVEETMKEMYGRGVVHVPLCYLAKSLEKMAECDAVYFCRGWESARGCRIEFTAASQYGLTVMFEEGIG